MDISLKVGRVAAGDGAHTATTRKPVQEAPAAKITYIPAPLRFPWLSRLTAELEPVAKQKPPFPSTPALGYHIDKAA